MRMPRNIEKIMMAVWFILFGVLTQTLARIDFAHSGNVLAALAVIVGVILLIQPR